MPPVTTARSLRLKARTIEAAIRHLEICIEIEVTATLALNQFQTRYTLAMRNTDPLLRAEETRLIAAKTKAWNDRFAAWRAANPPTIEDVLWIVAKNGYSDLIAKLINLSKFTRICQNLQPVMREVKNKRVETQLRYFCRHGMTASVVRMLEMRSIDVEAKGGEHGSTCLIVAALNGHFAICRLLLDKGAQLEAKDSDGWTPLHYAAWNGHVEFVRLICDHGADVEARDNDGWTPIHWAAYNGHISVVKELIDERNAEINARMNGGRTALTWARRYNKPDIAAYLVSRGGIE
jgi:hypothetical protein